MFFVSTCLMQNSICGFGKARDADVRAAAEKVLAAWGVATVVSRRGRVSHSNVSDASVQTCLTNTLNEMIPYELQHTFL